jgi:hypothetical protein
VTGGVVVAGLAVVVGVESVADVPGTVVVVDRRRAGARSPAILR